MPRARVNWEACHRRMEELRKRLRRDITPRDVLKDAQSEASPFRSYFEWDNTKAAAKFHLQQARSLIQHLKVIYVDEGGHEVSVRKYLRVRLETPAETVLRSGYVPRERVLRTSHLKAQIVEQAKVMLQSFRRRFVNFTEIEATFPHIDAAISMLSGVKQKQLRKAK